MSQVYSIHNLQDAVFAPQMTEEPLQNRGQNA